MFPVCSPTPRRQPVPNSIRSANLPANRTLPMESRRGDSNPGPLHYEETAMCREQLRPVVKAPAIEQVPALTAQPQTTARGDLSCP